MLPKICPGAKIAIVFGKSTLKYFFVFLYCKMQAKQEKVHGDRVREGYMELPLSLS